MKKRHRAEQVVGKPRQADVAVGKRLKVRRSVRRRAWASRPAAGGCRRTAGWRRRTSAATTDRNSLRRRFGGWLRQASVGTMYTRRRVPGERYVESFNGRPRDDLLDRELFLSLAEARYVLDEWQLKHSHRRPHTGIGWQTPVAFAAAWKAIPPRRSGRQRRLVCRSGLGPRPGIGNLLQVRRRPVT